LKNQKRNTIRRKKKDERKKEEIEIRNKRRRKKQQMKRGCGMYEGEAMTVMPICSGGDNVAVV
jgi:hypothetical protein